MKPRRFALLAIILMLLLTSCAQQPTATQVAVQPTEAPLATEAVVVTEAPQVTEAPTAVPTEMIDLNVFAAASLTEPFGEIGKMFEAAHPGVMVVYNFAGSQQLAQQINEGAPADVFASANKKQMGVTIDAGSVISGTEQVFAKNRLVVIFPNDNPAGIAELQDLAQPDLKLVLAAKEVPVGQYSLDFLDKAVADPAFGATFKDDVLNNVVSYEDNVKAVLTKVTLGEADAGIVYLSDISGADADKVDRIEIPDTLNVIASYPIAPIKESKKPELAQAFIDLVLSQDGQDILAKYNFIPVAKPSQPVDLNVFAAASLTEPFGEIGKLFEADHPGVTAIFNFAGSQQLAQQINEGAPADVFASANKKQMDVTIDAGSVVSGTEQVFAKNRLVVIFPKDNPAGLAELKDLAQPDLKLVLAAKEVPVGQYSLDFLDKAVADPAFGATFKDDVLNNVVSYEDNVKAVLTKVALGEADAGIVYLSDISGADADKVGRIDIPDTLNVIASYPIAAVKESKIPELAQAFVDLVLSQEGQEILTKYNFIPVK